MKNLADLADMCPTMKILHKFKKWANTFAISCVFDGNDLKLDKILGKG